MLNHSLTWQTEVPFPIWTVKSEVGGNYLVVEVREPDSGDISLLVVNKQSGSVEQTVIPEERKRVVLRGVCNNLLLISFFKDLSRPDQQDLLAYSFTGTLVWWKADFCFQELSGETIRGLHTKLGGSTVYLQGSTGNQTTHFKESQPQYWTAFYPQDSASFTTLTTFVQLKTELKPATGIDYMEGFGLATIKFGMLEAGNSMGVLLVTNEGGEVLLLEKIVTDWEGFMTGVFFMDGRSVTYIRNRRVIGQFTFL